jgi:hypothetical protein
VNLVRETLKIVGRELDRDGHLIEGLSALKTSSKRQMAVPTPE